MQVSLLALQDHTLYPGSNGGVLLPDLLQLTRSSPATPTLREQRAEQERDRRRDREHQSAGAAGVSTHPADLIRADEREMAPNSRAARRDIQDGQQRQTLQQRDTFQRSLAEAAAREQQRGGLNTSAAGESGGAKPDAAKDSTNQNARSAPASAPASTNANPAPTDGAANSTTPASAPANAANVLPPGNSGRAAGPASAAAEVSGAASAASESALRVAAVGRAADPAGNTPDLPESTEAAPSAGVAKSASGGAARSAESAPTTAVGARGPATKATVAAARAADIADPEPGKFDANVERMLRVLRGHIGQGRSQTTLRLDPPELGTVRMHLDLRADALSLRIEPQTALAHRLLSEQLDSLRQGLEASGIQLEHVEIRPPPPDPQPGQDGLPQQPEGHSYGDAGGSQADAEHPQSGTEPTTVEPTGERSARDAPSGPVTESRVNILA